jgi:hypothetical protein
MKLTTFPTDLPHIDVTRKYLPEYMRPCDVPLAVLIEGAFLKDYCEMITNWGLEQDPYDFQHCGATTRELPATRPNHLDPMADLAATINHHFFKFELDPDPHCWMQSYSVYGDYQMHTDGVPGQSRKLTAVLMLTDESEYAGGFLELHLPSQSPISIPREQGTMVIFPSWMWHCVTRVLEGKRNTINMGFWGPPFR